MLTGEAAAEVREIDGYLEGLSWCAETNAVWTHARPRIRCHLTSRQPPVDLVGSARAIVFQGEEVLVVRNVHEEYFTPGGRREPGESIEQVVRREVLEETGWTLGPLTQFAVLHLYFDNDAPPGHTLPHPDVLWPVHVAAAVEYHADSRLFDGYDLEASFRPLAYAQALPVSEVDKQLLTQALQIAPTRQNLRRSPT